MDAERQFYYCPLISCQTRMNGMSTHLNLGTAPIDRRMPAPVPLRRHSAGIGPIAVWAGAGLWRWGTAAASRRDGLAAVRRDRALHNYQIRRQAEEELARRNEAIYRTWFYGR